MSDCKRCDHCGEIGFRDTMKTWWRVLPATYLDGRKELDACSWRCLGEIALDRAGDQFSELGETE